MCLLLLLFLLGSPWGSNRASEPLAGLLTAISRPAPASTEFTEVRFSNLLTQPLVVSGTLEYRGPGQLGKSITQPHRETTSISADRVEIVRQGQQPRRFSLDRAPELRGLLGSFSALLAGDRRALEADFELSVVDAQGRWQIVLIPRNRKMQRRVAEIRVLGAADSMRCVVVTEPDADASVMLLGDAAQPPLEPTVDRATVDGRCNGN